MSDPMAPRYNVRTDVPVRLRAHGFVAYIADAHHPDRESDDGPLSCSWFITAADAVRICAALNRGISK